MPSEISSKVIRTLCKAMTEGQSGILLLTDSDATLTFASASAKEFFKLPPQVTARRIDTFLPAGALKSWAATLRKAESQQVTLPIPDNLATHQTKSSQIHFKFSHLSLDSQIHILISVTAQRPIAKEHDDMINIYDVLGKMLDPVTVIRGYCEALLPAQTQGRPALQTIERNAEKLTQQIQDLRKTVQRLLPTQIK